MKVIDLFAGLGGFTEAARRVGLNVVWAANHWRSAVEVHAANHPRCVHSCQDLQQADWTSVPAHDVLLSSPCCQGHSRARGRDKPNHDASRSTAWSVVSCAEFHRPRLVVVENVPEFLTWPLFPIWRLALERLGYAISINKLDAADCGTPQNRIRAFVVGVLGTTPIKIGLPNCVQKSAETIIDFKQGNWSRVRRPGRAAATLERFIQGRANFGSRFLFSYYGNTKTARPLSRPIGTITTRDRWAVVNDDWMRMLTVREASRAMGFGDHYILPKNNRIAMHMLGNAVPPDMAAHVIRQSVSQL
jgi:DNA (cytosine-5)-methyltransferase 1